MRARTLAEISNVYVVNDNHVFGECTRLRSRRRRPNDGGFYFLQLSTRDSDTYAIFFSFGSELLGFAERYAALDRARKSLSFVTLVDVLKNEKTSSNRPRRLVFKTRTGSLAFERRNVDLDFP